MYSKIVLRADEISSATKAGDFGIRKNDPLNRVWSFPSPHYSVTRLYSRTYTEDWANLIFSFAPFWSPLTPRCPLFDFLPAPSTSFANPSDNRNVIRDSSVGRQSSLTRVQGGWRGWWFDGMPLWRFVLFKNKMRLRTHLTSFPFYSCLESRRNPLPIGSLKYSWRLCKNEERTRRDGLVKNRVARLLPLCPPRAGETEINCLENALYFSPLWTSSTFRVRPFTDKSHVNVLAV